MNAISGTSVQKWSMEGVPSRERFDYYASALAAEVTPMQVGGSGPETFDAGMRWARLGAVSVLNMSGSAHSVVRDSRDISRSADRTFHLLVNLTSPMNFVHGKTFHAAAGDAVFVDSDLEYRLDLPFAYDVVHLRLSEAFVMQWVSRPSALVGTSISPKSGWGSSLCSFVRQLTPEFAANAPLPQAVIADQLGALLALVGADASSAPALPLRKDKVLLQRILDCTAQRCAEPSLVASDIAASLNISTRTLHRTLASDGRMFSNVLMAARISVAARMLASPLFKRLTTAEIGRRAGFSDASHFARVFKRHTGTTPVAARRDSAS
jgi:AraC-like DNA-binding protein